MTPSLIPLSYMSPKKIEVDPEVYLMCHPKANNNSRINSTNTFEFNATMSTGSYTKLYTEEETKFFSDFVNSFEHEAVESVSPLHQENVVDPPPSMNPFDFVPIPSQESVVAESPSPSPPPVQEKPVIAETLSPGEPVEYRKSDGTWVKAVLKAVHYDDEMVPYYTINLVDSGADMEKSTIPERLRRASPSPPPVPEEPAAPTEKPTKQRKSRCCGVCGLPGHTRITCPILHPKKAARRVRAQNKKTQQKTQAPKSTPPPPPTPNGEEIFAETATVSYSIKFIVPAGVQAGSVIKVPYMIPTPTGMEKKIHDFTIKAHQLKHKQLYITIPI